MTEENGARLVEQLTNQRGEVTKYKFEVVHRGLQELKIVGDHDYEIAERKADALLKKFEAKWARIKSEEESRKRQQISKADAEHRSAEALAKLDSVRTILRDGLSNPPAVDWRALICVKQKLSTHSLRNRRRVTDLSGR